MLSLGASGEGVVVADDTGRIQEMLSDYDAGVAFVEGSSAGDGGCSIAPAPTSRLPLLRVCARVAEWRRPPSLAADAASACAALTPVRTRALVLLALGALGCSGATPSEQPEPVSVWVDVGLPGGSDGLQFMALPSGGAVPLQTFGQGGTHALLAVRTNGLGDRAFVSVIIRNTATGAEVSAPAGASPRLLACQDTGECDLLPLLVMTGGLVAPGQTRDGLAVLVRVDATGAEGASASVEREARLTTESL